MSQSGIEWACPNCYFSNTYDYTDCKICFTPRPRVTKTPSQMAQDRCLYAYKNEWSYTWETTQPDCKKVEK